MLLRTACMRNNSNPVESMPVYPAAVLLQQLPSLSWQCEQCTNVHITKSGSILQVEGYLGGKYLLLSQPRFVGACPAAPGRDTMAQVDHVFVTVESEPRVSSEGPGACSHALETRNQAGPHCTRGSLPRARLRTSRARQGIN